MRTLPYAKRGRFDARLLLASGRRRPHFHAPQCATDCFRRWSTQRQSVPPQRLMNNCDSSAGFESRPANIKAIAGMSTARLVLSAPISETRVLIAPPHRRAAELRRGSSRRFRRASIAYEGALPTGALYNSISRLLEVLWSAFARHLARCTSVVFHGWNNNPIPRSDIVH